jgi:hypothetical protein
MQTSSMNLIANLFRHSIQKIIHHEQIGLLLGMKRWFNICKSINIKQHVNKDMTHIIISIDAESS